MFIYWLLLAFPAVMALTHPAEAPRDAHRGGRGFAFVIFVLVYTLIGGLRYQTGGDYWNYSEMFEDIRTDTLAYSLTRTDPLYGLLNWTSAQLGTGVQLVNAVCCLILSYGVVRVARLQREPWLAIVIAVPYLLIVVGMGYVRQAAAIGMMLLAIATIDNRRPFKSFLFLTLGVFFHSTFALVVPIFVFSLARHNKMLAATLGIVGVLIFYATLAPRLDNFQANYLDTGYDSSGAVARLMMSLVPSLLILLRWRHFVAGPKARQVWMMIAFANLAGILALWLSPSSTAVDRIALFFSVIQLAAYGEFRDLSGANAATMPVTRLALVAVAIAVQSVWLIFATHSFFWVPYRSVLDLL